MMAPLGGEGGGGGGCVGDCQASLAGTMLAVALSLLVAPSGGARAPYHLNRIENVIACTALDDAALFLLRAKRFPLQPSHMPQELMQKVPPSSL